MKGRLGPGGKLTLSVNALFLFGINLSNTYVSIFLWKTSESLITVAWYHVYQFVGLMIGSLLAGKFAEVTDRTRCLRIGIFLHALFFAAVLLFKSDAGLHLPRLGLLLGVGTGFYWLGSNVLSYDLTDQWNVDYFHGLFSVFNSLAMTVAPFLAGWFILQFPSTIGYTYLFAGSLGLFVVTIFISMKLYTRNADGQFTLRPAIIPASVRPNWSRFSLIHFLNGARHGVFVFLIGVILYEVTGSEFGIGVYSLLTGSVTFATSFIVARRIGPQMRKRAMMWGQVASSVGVVSLALLPNVVGLSIFGLLESIAFPIYSIPFGALFFDLIDADPKSADHRVEYMVAREVPLNIGRLAGLAGFLLLGGGMLDEPLKRSLIVVAYGTIPTLGLFALRGLET